MSDSANKTNNTGDGYLAKGAKAAFTKVTNDIKTAAAQNEFLDDVNVDQGRIHNVASDVMDVVNVAGATVNGVVSAPLSLASGGHVNLSLATPRTLRDAFHKKADRVFDRQAAKECNEAAFAGEEVTIDDRKQAYGQSERGQVQVEKAKDALDRLYGVDSPAPDNGNDNDDFDL